jgi:hypothetical protein
MAPIYFLGVKTLLYYMICAHALDQNNNKVLTKEIATEAGLAFAPNALSRSLSGLVI